MNRSYVFVFAAAVGACNVHNFILKQQMERATASPNPMTKGSLLVTPIATTRDGGMARIVTADANEVCVNGEVRADPGQVKNLSFVMQTFTTPDEDPAKVPTSKSTSIKILGTSDQMTTAGRVTVTDFQTCFPNGGVFSPKTAYLVVSADRSPLLGSPFIAVWHFDDGIRHMSAMR